MALPGWTSLSSSVEIHATLEGIAVAFFVALVVFDVLAHLNKERELLLERIALVCFAVAVLAEVCAYPYSMRVDTLSSEASAKLNKEAGDARKDAAAAIERAAKAEERAAKADERASKNEREAAILRKRAEDEAIARVKIEAQIAHRHLTARQREAVKNEISTIGLHLVEVGSVIGDNEAREYAEELADALAQAGVKVRRAMERSVLDRRGVIILVGNNSPETSVRFATALLSALTRAGIPVLQGIGRDRNNAMATDEIELLVSTKP